MSSNVVTQQPGGPLPKGFVRWAHTTGERSPDTPEGLEHLAQVDRLHVHQKTELLEAFTGWQVNNKYAVMNSNGEQLYYAFEETSKCMRCCCQGQREFTLHIVNENVKEVMRIYRPLKICAGSCWCAGFCGCCAQELFVEAPPGKVVGSIRQTTGACTLNFELLDTNENVQLVVKGPCHAGWCPCLNATFTVYSKDGSREVGQVCKKWAGLARELFTEQENFTATFPADLDVNSKATMLGALFLIDLMVYEEDCWTD